jgi:oligopeptide transport system substrate-binding protein
LTIFTVVVSACSDASFGPPPRLVEPTPDRLAALLEKGPEARPDGPVTDPKALTSAAEFEAFRKECETLQPRSVEEGSRDALGTVFRGKNPVDLPALPRDGIYRFVEGNPEFIDPNKVAESSGTSIVSNLFETLLLTAPGNTPPEPGAAERFEVSPDGRTYTFHLRKTLVWSDGRPTTAHDYVYSWKRALDPATGSKNAQQLWIIEGAKPYNEGKVQTSDGVGVRALDDHTLEVRLVGPAPYFPDLVTYVAFAPVPRWAIEAHGDQWTRPGKIVTNGPFLLSKWLERDRFELKRNPTYWDAPNVKLEGAIVYISDSEAQTLILYQSGQTHTAYPLAPDTVQNAIREGRADLRIDLNACVYYYSLRIDRPPFNDVRIRRALNLSLDKKALVQHVLGAFQTPATSLVPTMFQTFMGYLAPEGEGYDPELASALLAEAGHPNGRGLVGLDIAYNTSEGHKRIAEFAAKQWKETLGIDFSASNMEWKSLLKKQQSGDFQISRSAWCADYPDPLNFLEIYHSSSDNNYSSYKNPAYDDMLERARKEADPWTRRVLLCAAEKGLMRDTPFVPMYQYTRSILLRPEVKGHLPQYQDHHLLKWISLD